MFSSGGGFLTNALNTLSTQSHFINISKGVIDFRDVIYYLSFIAIFLYLNIQTLSKRKQSFHTGAQIALFVGIAIVANILLSSTSFKIDLTDQKQYTLSSASKEIVSTLEDPVTIKIFFSDELPQNLIALKQDVEDLTAEYKRAGKSNVIIEEIDPKDDINARTEAQTLGIPEIQFNVVESEKFEVTTGYTGIALLYRDKNEALPVIQDTSSLEYEITAAINKMSKETLPTVAILAGETSSVSALASLLQKQYTVSNITAADLENLQGDNLLIVGTTAEFNQKQQYKIDQFLMKGGNLFVMIDGAIVDQQYLQVMPNETNLKEMLASYGVTVNSDLIADYGSAETLTFGGGMFSVMREYYLWPKIIAEGFNSESPITQKLQTAVLPWASSLTINASSDVVVTELMKSSIYSESIVDAGTAAPDSIIAPATEDNLSAQLIGAMLQGKIQSKFAGQEKPEGVDESAFVSEAQNSNLFVVANSQFIDDSLLEQSAENSLLVLNSIDFLNQDAALANIRSRSALNRPIQILTDSKKVVIKYTNIFSSVILVIIVAGVAIIIRKRRTTKAVNNYA